MDYFIVRNGQQAGPFPVDRLAAEGVTPSTQIWCQGMANWAPASSVPEVANALEMASYQQPPQYQNPPQYQTPGYQPQQPYQPFGPQTSSTPMPKTYMTEAILVTLFCCLPFGIAAIVNASNVSSAYTMGNVALAEEKSKNAKKWCTWGLVSSLIIFLLYLLFYAVLFGFMAMGL